MTLASQKIIVIMRNTDASGDDEMKVLECTDLFAKVSNQAQIRYILSIKYLAIMVWWVLFAYNLHCRLFNSIAAEVEVRQQAKPAPGSWVLGTR